MNDTEEQIELYQGRIGSFQMLIIYAIGYLLFFLTNSEKFRIVLVFKKKESLLQLFLVTQSCKLKTNSANRIKIKMLFGENMFQLN